MRDLFLPLICGGKLCIPTIEQQRDILFLLNWLQSSEVNLIHTIPSIVANWLNLEFSDNLNLNKLQYVCLSGEPLLSALIEKWKQKLPYSKTKFINFYGPSETTMIKTFHEISDNIKSGVQFCGKPISNSEIYIFSDESTRAELGETGEIFIRTPFTTLGYIGADDQSNKRFMHNPFRTDKYDIFYKTGDLGYLTLDGLLMVLGRVDDEIKINGVRIHPVEINNVISSHQSVKLSVVLAYKPHNTVLLLAFVVSNESEILNERTLRDFLSDYLPSVMIPHQFYFIKNLPLLINGKINRKELISTYLLDMPDACIPDNEIENKILACCKILLNKKEINLDSNFFALGGTSLMLLSLVTQIRQIFSIELSLKEILENLSIRQLSKIIDIKLRKNNSFLETQPSKQEPWMQESWLHIIKTSPNVKFRLICFHYAGGNAYIFNVLSQYFPDDIELIGIQLPGRMNLLEMPTFTQLDDLIPLLFLQLQSYLNTMPYAFLGYSLGGLISYCLVHYIKSKRITLPVAMFIAATRAPNIKSRFQNLHMLPDNEFIEVLKKYGGTPNEVLTNHELIQFMLPLLRADFCLFESYQHNANLLPLDCPIFTYGGTADPQATSDDLKGWQIETTNRYDLKLFSGDHFFIKTNLSDFANALLSDLGSVANLEEGW